MRADAIIERISTIVDLGVGPGAPSLIGKNPQNVSPSM